MNNMNPKAVALYWCFTVLMAGAIALGPEAILGVAAVMVAYTIYAVLT